MCIVLTACGYTIYNTLCYCISGFSKFFDKSEFMCISPVRIRNPNYHNKSRIISRISDTTSAYINVPCGHCAECVKVRQMSIIQRVQMEELENHLFFCTLTYNNESLPVITTSTGYDIRYADYRDVQLMIKRLRNTDAFGRPFRFFGVSELGSLRSRPHFHLIFFLPKRDDDTFGDILNLEDKLFHAVLFEWRRNYGSNRNPIYRPLCTYVRKFVRGKLKSNFDLHYVNPRTSDGGTADVAFYVTKYMLKSSDREVRLQQALKLNLPDDEYEATWKIVRTRSFSSLKFGYNDSDRIVKYIRDCVDTSLRYEDSPKFYNPVDGSSFPLSRYYLNRGVFYGVDDAFAFHAKKSLPDNVVFDDKPLSERLLAIEKHEKSLRLIDSNDESYIFDEL